VLSRRLRLLRLERATALSSVTRRKPLRHPIWLSMHCRIAAKRITRR
jgi:hypothetical protein